jgi:hypothetical protein
MVMRLREVKRSVSSLSFRQLVKLDAWLHGLMETAERAGSREAVAEHHIGHKTYQSEMVRCGKKGCRCSRGEMHGPYWYAYWTEGRKTRSEYVGKELPGKRKKPAARGVR